MHLIISYFRKEVSADGKVVKVYYYNGDLKVRSSSIYVLSLSESVTLSCTNVFGFPYISFKIPVIELFCFIKKYFYVKYVYFYAFQFVIPSVSRSQAWHFFYIVAFNNLYILIWMSRLITTFWQFLIWFIL